MWTSDPFPVDSISPLEFDFLEGHQLYQDQYSDPPQETEANAFEVVDYLGNFEMKNTELLQELVASNSCNNLHSDHLKSTNIQSTENLFPKVRSLQKYHLSKMQNSSSCSHSWNTPLNHIQDPLREQKISKYRAKRSKRNFTKLVDNKLSSLAQNRERDGAGHFLPRRKSTRTDSLGNRLATTEIECIKLRSQLDLSNKQIESLKMALERKQRQLKEVMDSQKSHYQPPYKMKIQCDQSHLASYDQIQQRQVPTPYDQIQQQQIPTPYDQIQQQQVPTPYDQIQQQQVPTPYQIQQTTPIYDQIQQIPSYDQIQETITTTISYDQKEQSNRMPYDENNEQIITNSTDSNIGSGNIANSNNSSSISYENRSPYNLQMYLCDTSKSEYDSTQKGLLFEETLSSFDEKADLYNANQSFYDRQQHLSSYDPCSPENHSHEYFYDGTESECSTTTIEAGSTTTNTSEEIIERNREKFKKLGGPPSDVYLPWCNYMNLKHPAFAKKEDWLTTFELRPNDVDPKMLARERLIYVLTQHSRKQEQIRIAENATQIREGGFQPVLSHKPSKAANNINYYHSFINPNVSSMNKQPISSGYWDGNFVPNAEFIDFSKVPLRRTSS